MTIDICKYCREPIELAVLEGGLDTSPKLVHSNNMMTTRSDPFFHYVTRATPEEAAHKPFKNIKPGMLPVDTVIGFNKHGGIHYEELYIHQETEDGFRFWQDLFSGCGHCDDPEKISDSGCSKEDTYGRGGFTTEKPSDVYFPDYKVIAVPPGFDFEMVSLHGNLKLINDIWVHEDGAHIHECKGFNCDA